MTKLRLVVADDNTAFLRKLSSLLAAEFEVVGTAADGQSAIDLIDRYKPDVVVLDLKMPGLSGIEVTTKLVQNTLFGPKVVICSVETDRELIEAAQKAGALAYVFKARVAKDLNIAVKSAAANKWFLSLASP